VNLLLASNNAHKAREVREILAGTGITVQTLLERPDLPEPEETGATFEENALLKARVIHELTGLPVVADDSGLEVDALGGAPGVHSKRFSPDQTADANNRLLLERLEGRADRAARFRCVLALVADGFHGTVHGACEGRIAVEPQGVGGFGYDPVFLPDELGERTMAEASPDEKNAISHRGRAFRQLPALLARAGLPRDVHDRAEPEGTSDERRRHDGDEL